MAATAARAATPIAEDGSFPAVGITGALFEENGYTTLAPGWPDDPETVEEAQHDVVRIASSSATK